ncbi:hypothetical protein BC936DRAFT_145920 [Jimgerdemannia flammicorona]|uniref:DUF5615 domain-containing protein n=1 Tax=Jimgerdemannia flammicorona TaxID=994334 RepID=A0A433D8W1_9FUNG|nr:hypothetical protein BC936DRAFT_145920 [Jimgerdemannia flammicorona]
MSPNSLQWFFALRWCTESPTMSVFKCKFDEHFLDVVRRNVLAEFKSHFTDPDGFVDDVDIEGIRGQDDATVLIHAANTGRTLITNDADVFFLPDNTYGTIVLRGGVREVNGPSWCNLNRFSRDERKEVFCLLFRNYMADMER